MQLDEIKADAQCAFGRFDELLLDVRQAAQAQRFRHVPAWTERQRGRRHGGPGTLAGCERLAAFEGRMCRTFAAGVCKLDAKFDDAMLAAEIDHMLDGLFVFVAIEPKTTRRDASHG